MLPVHCQAWSCLSIVPLECTSPTKRFPPKTANEKKLLPTQSLTCILTDNQWTLLKLTNTIKELDSTSTTKTKTNNYTRRLRYIMNTWRTLLKLTNTKNWTTKYQIINIQPMKTKTIKYTRRLRYITSTWRTLIKLKNTKNWTWRNKKQKWTLLNWQMQKNWTWRNTKQTWTLLKKKKTERYFYDGAQNKHENYWKTEQHFYEGTLNRTQLHFGQTSNKHIQIKQTSKPPTKKVNENIQSTTNKYALLIPVTEKSEERKTI